MSSISPDRTRAHGEPNSNGAVGVQDLIDRLKSEGVKEGQQQAATVLAEAKKQAARIVETAHAEADTILHEAQQQAERTTTNGKRALQLAKRDTSLQLKEQLEHQFRGWIGNLVSQQLDAPELLTDLIREMASEVTTMIAEPTGSSSVDHSSSVDQPSRVKFLVAGEESESLEAYVKGQAAEMFRQGVQLQADRSLDHGFRVQLAGKSIEIDFSDDAVTAALMRFLAPKFRRILGSSSEGE
ncbi:hypothetical protein [Novipirellula artificiosorum]|uniref:V-type ATP synthase subunit E n=1 Tax=Novipirellula artificiosorum TaxID=2528016 RepID=A0A5C6D6A9_9BACT|nr:hypothetical protein [Novipirellula artificiosorum]TWU32462.1 V-type ATP synthase subunit E [Novipirellula artificiosorum]